MELLKIKIIKEKEFYDLPTRSSPVVCAGLVSSMMSEHNRHFSMPSLLLLPLSNAHGANPVDFQLNVWCLLQGCLKPRNGSRGWGTRRIHQVQKVGQILLMPGPVSAVCKPRITSDDDRISIKNKMAG